MSATFQYGCNGVPGAAGRSWKSAGRCVHANGSLATMDASVQRAAHSLRASTDVDTARSRGRRQRTGRGSEPTTLQTMLRARSTSDEGYVRARFRKPRVTMSATFQCGCNGVPRPAVLRRRPCKAVGRCVYASGGLVTMLARSAGHGTRGRGVELIVDALLERATRVHGWNLDSSGPRQHHALAV